MDTTSGGAAIAHVAGGAAEKVSEVAREAGEQARTVASRVCSQGNQLLDAIEDATRRNPLGGLLLAGGIGFGLALFIHRR